MSKYKTNTNSGEGIVRKTWEEHLGLNPDNEPGKKS